jgi:predicted PurR-regulated permease PerM
MQHGPSTDITRVVLSVLVIGALLVGSLWTLWPFLSGVIWATTIVVATWPALVRLQGLTGGRRGLAAAIMTVLVLLAFIAPLAIAIDTLYQAAQTSPAVMSDFLERGVGPPPAWVAKIPWFGDSLAADWQTAAAANLLQSKCSFLHGTYRRAVSDIPKLRPGWV